MYRPAPGIKDFEKRNECSHVFGMKARAHCHDEIRPSGPYQFYGIELSMFAPGFSEDGVVRFYINLVHPRQEFFTRPPGSFHHVPGLPTLVALFCWFALRRRQAYRVG